VPQILTFLGQPRYDCAIAAIAIARQLAQQGAKVLWLTRDTGPLPGILWNQPLTTEIQSVSPNLWTLQFQSTTLLEESWEVVKQIEAQYLRDPLLKAVFGQELVILPGMDEALALNAIRELYEAGEYDYLVVDSPSTPSTLRMWGLPENLDWYMRRFQKVIQSSDLARAITPFIQPIASTILNVSGSQDSLNQPLQQARSFLDAGRTALQSPDQVLGFVVTSDRPEDVQTNRYFWGSAQQLGLTVASAIAIAPTHASAIEAAFAPLETYSLPALTNHQWEPLITAAPEIDTVRQTAPIPVMVNEVDKQVRLFLPGFTKADIMLTQYGPEVTVTVGDQRRNLFLPDSLKNRPVQGAKFQEDYLILSF